MTTSGAGTDPTAGRVDYNVGSLSRADLAPHPVVQLRRWLADAAEAGDAEPNAMVLATVDGEGRPRARNVLLRDLDERGLDFYSNRNSAKGQAIAVNPVAVALFSWLGMHRQVRVDADVELLDDDVVDAYWRTRPRDSQLASAASPQGEVVADRAVLDATVQRLTQEWEGRDIPRPHQWVGYRLVPFTFEFWQGRHARLHDRFRYRSLDGAWQVDRLAP